MCIYIYLYITWAFSLCKHNGPEIPSWCRRATVEQFWPREGHGMMDETEKKNWTQFETNSLVICCLIPETPRKTRSSQPLLTWGPQPGIDHWDRGAGTTGGQKKMIEMKIDLSVPQQTMLKWEFNWESLRNPQGMKPNMKLSGRLFLKPILGNQLKYGSQLQTNQIWVNLSRN
jgi:hypothetical protein